MISARPFVVGIGGTIRPNSSSECALKVSLSAAEYHGAETLLISGRELLLPMYEPGADHTVGAQPIVDAFRRCDGVIVSSPAYHGSVSGLLKNALDYAESCDRTHEPTSTEWPSAAFLVQADGRRADRHWLPCAQSSMHFAAGLHPSASRSTPPPNYLMKTGTASILQ